MITKNFLSELERGLVPYPTDVAGRVTEDVGVASLELIAKTPTNDFAILGEMSAAGSHNRMIFRRA
jgi:hypothetical protein